MLSGFLKRVEAVEDELAAARCLRDREEPASVRWLRFLKAALPALERGDRTAESEAVLARVRSSIGLLEGYVAGDLRTDPWSYLEYYCHGCLLRLRWTGPGWEGRQMAFLEPDYEEHFRRIEAIERAHRSSRPATTSPHVGREESRGANDDREREQSR